MISLVTRALVIIFERDPWNWKTFFDDLSYYKRRADSESHTESVFFFFYSVPRNPLAIPQKIL